MRMVQTQVEQLRAHTILIFGIATAHLMDPQLQRGTVQNLQGRRLVVTHSLRQMLDNPAMKAEVWRDLCLASHDV